MNWNVIRASVSGTSHDAIGQPCQDDCFADVFTGVEGFDYLLCVVSDGAGSAKEGGTGAELACITTVACIESDLMKLREDELDEYHVEEWVKTVRREIYTKADVNGLKARDYACTLLGAVVGRSKAVFFQIGDGAIVASNNDVQGVVFWPDSGLYANMTYFVTEEDAFNHLHIKVTNSNINEIALFSDGIQRLSLAFELRIPFTPFFDPMLKILRKSNTVDCEILSGQLAQFLKSSPINERTDDDKTLILATRRMHD